MSRWSVDLCFKWGLFVLILAVTAKASKPCALRRYSTGMVCVCNATYCDELDDETVKANDPNEIIIVSTSRNGLRFQVTKGLWNDTAPIIVADRPLRRRKIRDVITVVAPNGKSITWNSFFFSRFRSQENEVTINVNPEKKFQKILGFGGAVTGAVIHNAEKLSPDLQRALYESYFSPTKGIAYTFARIPIGGCDFDLAPWAYNEQPVNDKRLSNFTKLDARDEKLVEHLKQIAAIVGNDKLKIKGAAWSPPPWFKSNNAWTGESVLKHDYYQTWADYHVRYLELMKSAGVNVWGISTGNEPMNGVGLGPLFVKFMSLGWTPEGLSLWIAENLGPTMKNSSFAHVKILAGDDQRFLFPWYYNAMRRMQPKAFDYVDGFGVHFYWDKFFSPRAMDETAAQFPGKFILNTESCLGDKPYQAHGPVLGSWDRGVEYFESYLQDLQHSVNGWIDWNLWLDESGGPNYVNNTVDSPIVVNATTGAEAYKQPMFYAIGHFSKFLPEGAVRVEAISSRETIVDVVGFEREDGVMVLVMLNKHQSKVAKVEINDPRTGKKMLELAPDSFHTVVYNAAG